MIAGIDGGGTSAKFELRDERNQVIRRAKYGPFNVSSVGEEGIRKVICDIARDVSLAEITHFCIGCAGASYAGLKELILDEMQKHGFTGELKLCGDSEIALEGAITGVGGILIAGTGSVAFGKNAEGDTVRVGGWGHLIDDYGSGYSIGRDALAATVQTFDGRKQAEMLKNAVCKVTESETVRDILDYVYFSGRDKSATAAVAPSVLACAGEGDATSLEILQHNADALVQIIRALAVGLKEPRPKVALLGGLLANETIYGGIVREKLTDVCEVVDPEHDALWGAAQLAWFMK